MSKDERTNFMPAHIVASVDRYLRQSVNPTAPDIVPVKMANAKAGWSGHFAKERVRGDGTSGSQTPNVHVTRMLATSVDYTMVNGVQLRYPRLDRPRFRVICRPTYDDEIDSKSFGEKQIGTAIEGGEPKFIEDDLMAFEESQQETDSTERNAEGLESNERSIYEKQQIGTTAAGGKSVFFNDDLMAFEQGHQATRMMADTISVEMDLNDNLRPTRAHGFERHKAGEHDILVTPAAIPV